MAKREGAQHVSGADEPDSHGGKQANLKERDMEAVKIVIENVDGKVSVTGPLQNRALMYGLLELAKDIVRMQPQESNVIMPVPASRWAQ